MIVFFFVVKVWFLESIIFQALIMELLLLCFISVMRSLQVLRILILISGATFVYYSHITTKIECYT